MSLLEGRGSWTIVYLNTVDSSNIGSSTSGDPYGDGHGTLTRLKKALPLEHEEDVVIIIPLH
jgi:hypothetical protein